MPLDEPVSADMPVPDLPATERSSILDLIECIARAWPQSIALRGRADHITYGSLIIAVEELAGELCALGAGLETPIGICIDRSIGHVVALLAALRAGAAFLPLDPEWPLERINRVLDDAGAPIVVAQARLAGKLAAPLRKVIVSEAPRRRVSATFPHVTADSLAYIIYTSGSTGEPKGVEITHGALSNLVEWHRGAFGISAKDHASWLAGLGFDASVWELFPYLAVGATIHICDDSIRGSAEALQRWLIEEPISIAFVPTPLAETMIAADWPTTTELRWLLTGGDTLHRRPKAGLPFRLVNNYGPTECAVVVTSAVVEADHSASSLPTIGRAIANTAIVILGADGRVVEPAEIGEIYIAGAGLARGYRNRPSLTAERFVTLTLPGRSPQRYYRTGDLGCWTATGEIAFHGRSDDQLKLRGHRIEPDEISAALSRHALVAQATITAEGEGSDRRLIAYIVLAGEEAPRASELREFLAATLPSYMLPAVFVRLAALPLSSSGKIDKSALPPPNGANTLSNVRYRAPMSPVESRVAAIVEELLGIRSVGIDDNFFMLGGHSLLGTQLVLRLRDSFGAELSLRDLFEAQTIQNLAARVEESVFNMVAAMSEEELQQRLTN